MALNLNNGSTATLGVQFRRVVLAWFSDTPVRNLSNPGKQKKLFRSLVYIHWTQGVFWCWFSPIRCQWTAQENRNMDWRVETKKEL